MAKTAAVPVALSTARISPHDYNGPFQAVWCAKHHFIGPWPCDCKPGPQAQILGDMDPDGRMGEPVDETGGGGSRGGMKTETLLAWIAFKGNPRRTAQKMKAGYRVTGADAMYIAHPYYRGLILREQAADLGDLLDRAEAMYKPTGATITRGNPAMASWESGAKIIFGHFGDGGYAKYIGQEYQRIAIDQIERMESKEIHDRIIGSCRSKWPDLRPQTFCTFNPGGGDAEAGAPGQAWLMEYFHIEDYLSGKFPWGSVLRDEFGKTRLFVPSKVTDNPYLCYKTEIDEKGKTRVVMGADGEPIKGDYFRWLESIEPESLRRAWLDGDWRSLSGAYFKDFRPNGPLHDEPLNAKHVYDPETVQLEGWFHRWMGIDWGYIHPTDIQFWCEAPWGQQYTEKEISLNRVEPEELGVLIAREARPVLDQLPGHHMNIYLSPDAFAKRESENSVAMQLATGINRELGPKASFVADLTDDEREMDSDKALLSLQRRRRDQGATKLTILRASTDRVAGWMHLQTLLRFRPLQKSAEADMEFANRLYEEKGLIAYTEYMNLPEFKASKEILPKWQISSQCRELIKALPKAMHKPGTNDVQKWNATESNAGDDGPDCARMAGFSEFRQGERMAPLEMRVDQRVDDYKTAHPGASFTSVVQANIAARKTEAQKKPGKPAKPLPFVMHNRMQAARLMRTQRVGGGRA